MDNARSHLIELIAYWEGRVTTRHLIDAFHISRQQASKDIKEYNLSSKTPLIYKPSLKGHIPPERYLPRFISGDVSQYLNWLHSNGSGSESLTCKIRAPERHVSPQIMRYLVKAIRQQRRVDVDYVSLHWPDREGRVIVPHSFIDSGSRWHLRAWCEKHSEYRDFVLNRFRGEPKLMDSSPHGKSDDIAWNTVIELIFQPDLRLSLEQQEVIVSDYQMKGGQLRMQTKAALATYLLQQMQVNFKTLEADPKAQQLMLVNLDDVKQWLMH